MANRAAINHRLGQVSSYGMHSCHDKLSERSDIVVMTKTDSRTIISEPAEHVQWLPGYFNVVHAAFEAYVVWGW
jgi:hypothetical protein